MESSSRATPYIVGNDVMIIVSVLVVALRFYIRIKYSPRGIWWDDIFMLLALVFAIAFGALVNISMVHYGWSRHIWDIPEESLSGTLRTYIGAKVIFILASTCIRMSLLFFYFSLIRDLGSKALRSITLACIYANGLLGLVCCVFSIFQCSPVSATWTYASTKESKCLDDGIVTAIMGGFLCLADIVVNILPIPIVAMLRIPLRRRITIGLLMSLGSVATVAGFVREFWIYEALIRTNDSTWHALPLWICADVEIYVALLCTCAPTLKPLFTQIQLRVSAIVHGSTHSSLHVNPRNATTTDPSQWDIFDGTCLSNATHICADIEQNRSAHDSIYDRAKASVLRRANSDNTFEIQVVTHIQLDTVVSDDESDPP